MEKEGTFSKKRFKKDVRNTSYSKHPRGPKKSSESKVYSALPVFGQNLRSEVTDHENEIPSSCFRLERRRQDLKKNSFQPFPNDYYLISSIGLCYPQIFRDDNKDACIIWGFSCCHCLFWAVAWYLLVCVRLLHPLIISINLRRTYSDKMRDENFLHGLDEGCSWFVCGLRKSQWWRIFY